MFWDYFEGERVLRKKISSPFDRARRVVLETSMEHWEQVPRRIRGGITRIRCQLHLRVKQVSISFAIQLQPKRLILAVILCNRYVGIWLEEKYRKNDNEKCTRRISYEDYR